MTLRRASNFHFAAQPCHVIAGLDPAIQKV